jgi:hypothetical protein
MHRGHRASQLVDLHHSGSHLRILANETGSRIATLNRLHNPEPRTIPLDHLAHGLTRLPRELSEVNGTSSSRIKPHLIYIDDVLIHTDTHERHLEALEQVLLRLHQHHLKINLDKCLFGDRQVSYLGFSLTPEGIKPGEAKLKSIKQATPPDDVKGIRSFMGLCNFFRHHIQDFSIIVAPLFKLTRQDSEYQSGPLTKEALTAFQTLQNQLAKQPALAFP